MKLPIKKEFFDQIVNGTKIIEFRDAHITFVCEGTGETHRMNVVSVKLLNINEIPSILQRAELLEDNVIIAFTLSKPKDVVPNSTDSDDVRNTEVK